MIVVDDCSTDSSPAIVESYAEKFGERLTLLRMKKNSGGAGFSRNKGVELSRGEYIYFIDPNDTITPTALEELYTHAKKYDADVVHCEKWYNIPDHLWNNAEYRANPSHDTYPAKEKISITKPTFLADDFEQRILDYRKRWLTWSVCLQLICRNFILEHELKFGDFYCEDTVFTLCEISCAKKYLVIPNVIYHYRKREGAVTTVKLNVSQKIHKRVKAIMDGILQLDKFFNGIEFFSKRPNLKYIFFDFVAQDRFGYFNGVYAQFPAHALDELLRKEFAGGDNLALTSYIFNKTRVV